MSTPFDLAMSRIKYRYVRQPDPVTEEDLLQFEQEIGQRLPKNYRTFLAKYGLAAGTGNTRFTNSEEGNAGDNYDIRVIRKDLSEYLPDNLLPIASGSGGHFCLALSGDDAGTVYWWFPESGSVESEDDLEPVANSFEQFVNALVNVEE
jgi:hypothetical protein